jgi:hypothetical protein
LQTQRGCRPDRIPTDGRAIDAEDGEPTLTTTDLEVSARLAIDVQVTEAGAALVPARLLADTVKSLSDAPVEFETDQSQARIRCAAYEGSLRLLPAEDFPACKEPGGTGSRPTRRRSRRPCRRSPRRAATRRDPC